MGIRPIQMQSNLAFPKALMTRALELAAHEKSRDKEFGIKPKDATRLAEDIQKKLACMCRHVQERLRKETDWAKKLVGLNAGHTECEGGEEEERTQDPIVEDSGAAEKAEKFQEQVDAEEAAKEKVEA